MPNPQVDAAADWLLSKHESRQPFRGVEPWPAEPDEGFGYAVQERLHKRRGQHAPARVGGYKIGLTTPRMQQLCGGDRPISGLMFEAAIRQSPSVVAVSGFVRLGIESELAVRIARPLPEGVVSRDHVAAAASEVAAAFELIEDHGADYSSLDWLWMVADNSWHAGLVLGPAVPLRDVGDLAGRLYIDDVEVDRGSTRDVLGHPFDAVAWLANHLRARGLMIEPGHWVSTGSIATIRFPQPGQRYRFEIKGLPPVEVAISA